MIKHKKTYEKYLECKAGNREIKKPRNIPYLGVWIDKGETQ